MTFDRLTRMAELAGLPADASQTARDVDRLLAHIDRLKTVDTDGVEPTYTMPAPAHRASDLAATRAPAPTAADPRVLRALFVAQDQGALLVWSPAAGDPHPSTHRKADPPLSHEPL